MKLQSLFNVILLFTLASFPLVLQINKDILKGKNKHLNKFLKYGRKVHPFLGIILIISATIHGYNKLSGNLIFHTGSLLLMTLTLSGIIGFTYKRTHKRILALVHRIIGLIIILLFLLHYFNPWYFS